MQLFCLVAWLAKLVLTDEEIRHLKAVALELQAIRKLIDALAEAAVNLSGKEFLKAFCQPQEVDLTESELEHHEEKLRKQIYTAKKRSDCRL
jgi:hypothetical protein